MRLTLEEIKQETSDVTSFIFKPEHPLDWQAGQFFHYILHHEPTDNRGSDRWFSVSSAPYEEVIRLTTRFASQNGSSFKNALKKLKTGDDIEASDLEGDFILDNADRDYVFIAGGIGITPFRAILKQLDYEKKPIRVSLLYSNKGADNVPFKLELEELVKNHPEFQIHYFFSPDRLDEQKIRDLVPDFLEKMFYISGPEGMVESLGEDLTRMGLPQNQLKQDWFPGYSED